MLVCVDRSRRSAACVRQAVAVGKSLGSSITILHVMQAPNESAGLATDVLDWEISRQEAAAYLEKLEETASRALGRPIQTRLEQGRPPERIAAVASELGVDLTVLGSDRERGGAEWNLGSTALQVLAVTRSSVLIAHEGSNDAPNPSLKCVLVPLDGSIRTESVLPTAMQIAKESHAELLLALIVGEPIPTAVLSASDDLEVAQDLARRLEQNANRYLDTLREQLVREGVSVRTSVLRSHDQKQALLELSSAERCDLVILSAHGTTCNPALTFGSVATHFLTHSVTPLLVLQDLSDIELRHHDGSRSAPKLRGSYPPAGA